MTRQKKILSLAAAFVIAGSLAACAGTQMGFYETPVYQASKPSAQAAKNIEIRTYPPMLVAEVETSGPRREAINDAFRILADFIFGNNIPREDIAMTTPVIQEKTPVTKKGEKISMTTPVIQEQTSGSWKTRFVMPEKFTLETLPKPVNDKIRIFMSEPQRVAAIEFSGFSNDTNITRHEKILRDFLESNKIGFVPEPIYAYYDPPWTLPFLRRNEVMFHLK